MRNLTSSDHRLRFWGQNLLRNFCELEEAEVVRVCDFDSRALARAKRRYPTIEVTQNYAEVLADPKVDAVVLAHAGVDALSVCETGRCRPTNMSSWKSH